MQGKSVQDDVSAAKTMDAASKKGPTSTKGPRQTVVHVSEYK